MKAMNCSDLEHVLRDAQPEELRAFERHAETCARCAEELRAWNELCVAARAMHKEWASPHLWPQIQQALAAESQVARARPRTRSVAHLWANAWRQWQVAVAVLALAVVSVSGAWLLLRHPEPPVTSTPEAQRRLLTEQAIHQAEQAEAAYVASIEKLSALAQPKLENPATPLLASYREKLLLLDAAIAECRAQTDHNRGNRQLQDALLSMYQEKQRTLQEVVREAD